MKTFNYIPIIVAFLYFGGAVGASSLMDDQAIPTTEKVLTYINQAHLQERAF